MRRAGAIGPGMLALLMLLGGSSAARAQERYALVISGASGGPPYSENYDAWRTRLVLALRDRFRFSEDRIEVLAERPSANTATATRENVERALESLRRTMTDQDRVFVILIGHGSFDGIDAKFNLVGPDLEAAEWNALLEALPGRVAIINTTSASFPFVERLSAPRRVVLTATDSSAQRYETVFPESFVQALEDRDGTDLDKDGRVSLMEAFTVASARVRSWYEQQGRLATERPLLDDNADGTGKEAGQPGPDGALASRFYLDEMVEPTAEGNPALVELMRRRDRLEAEVDRLKQRRDSMDPAEYRQELERLLIELASVSHAIRSKS